MKPLIDKRGWKSNRNKPAYKILKEHMDLIAAERNFQNKEEPSIIDYMRAQQLQADVERKEKSFDKEISRSRPTIKEEQVLNKIDNEARRLAYSLTSVISKSIAFNLAMSYTKKMVSQDIGADGVELDWNTINEYARRCANLPVLSALAKHWDLNPEQTVQIEQLLVNKLWGIKPVDNANNNKRMEQFFTKLAQIVDKGTPTNPNHFGNINLPNIGTHTNNTNHSENNDD